MNKDVYKDMIIKMALQNGNIRLVKDAVAREYLKWLSYIPISWHVDELYLKMSSDLTNKEIDILKMIKNDQEYVIKFDIYLSWNNDWTKNDSEICYNVYKFVKDNNIEDYMQSKLTDQELNYCHKKINEHSMLETEKLKKIADKLSKSNNMLDLYIWHFLDKSLFYRSIAETQKRIISSIEQRESKRYFIGGQNPVL